MKTSLSKSRYTKYFQCTRSVDCILPPRHPCNGARVGEVERIGVKIESVYKIERIKTQTEVSPRKLYI